MGKVLMVLSGIALFIVDMLSLYALNLEHGLIWAVVAFFVIPLQIFVPFLVGTWPIALLLTGVFFLGAFWMTKRIKVLPKFLATIRAILIKIFTSFFMVIGIILALLLNYFFFTIWAGQSPFRW